MKRTLAWLMALCLVLTWGPADTWAYDEGGQAYDQTVTVGPGGYTDIQAALDGLGPDSGRVLLELTGDVTVDTDALLEVPRDKGITSLTLGTKLQKAVIGTAAGSFYLFANGVPLVLDRGISIKGNNAIFGGGRQAVIGGTDILVQAGASVEGTVYGGSLNSTVEGNVSITVYGAVKSLCGGGYAYVMSQTPEKNVKADVNGDIVIRVDGNASTVTNVHGGGRAYTSYDGECSLQADVFGDIDLYLNSPAMKDAEIHGGGNAHLGSSKPAVERNIQADVRGDIRLVLGGDAQSSASPGNMMSLWGGGEAETNFAVLADSAGENIAVSAQVYGDVVVDATADNHATSGVDDWDASMLSALFGGGDALGKWATATVNGNTSVSTSRKAQNFETGLAGGGRAVYGVARITGNTSVRVCRAQGQATGHENGKSAIGGGVCGNYGDVTVEGNTHVVIEDNIAFEGGGAGILGGGYISSGAQLGSNGTGGRADVLGSTTVRIGAGAVFPDPWYPMVVSGGGCIKEEENKPLEGTSANTGPAFVTLQGTKGLLNNLYGGGCNPNANTQSSQVVVQDSRVGWICDYDSEIREFSLTLLGSVGLEGIDLSDEEQGYENKAYSIQVGDGTMPTQVDVAVVVNCDQGVELSILPEAVLTNTRDEDLEDEFLLNVKRLDVQERGELVLEENQTISGALTGGGTIRLPAGKILTVDGSFEGTITLDSPGAAGDVLARSAKEQTTGMFRWAGERLALTKVENGGYYDWTLAEGKTVAAAVTGGPGGTLSPQMQCVAAGGMAEISVTREPGFKVAQVLVDGVDRMDALQGDTLRIGPVTDTCQVEVTFVQMDGGDVADSTGKLPDVTPDNPPSPDQQKSILETKLDYEALPEQERANLPAQAQEKLNQALNAVENIHTELSGTWTEGVSAPDLPNLLENMTRDEAAQVLRGGTGLEYKIAVQVDSAQPDSNVETSLTEALEGAVKSDTQFDITVKKVITQLEGEAVETEIHEIKTPILLVFQIPQALLDVPENTAREFTMFRTHWTGDSYVTQAIRDMDRQRETYTISSDKFSIYTLAYTDSLTSGKGTSSGLSRYEVALSAGMEHGAVSVSGTRAGKGETVTLTVRPNPGYALETLCVTDSLGRDVELENLGGGMYSFRMPASRVTVQAAFLPTEQIPLPFLDLDRSGWYLDAVRYVFAQGLMSGTSPSTFSPDGETTRGMLATILYQMEGRPVVDAGGIFSDVPASRYDAAPIAWGAAKGIIAGYDDGRFGPDDRITREQLALILYRYGSFRGYDVSHLADLSAFEDAQMVSSYAVQAVAWAGAEGIIHGVSDTQLSPQGPATRAQVAAMLMRFAQLN